MNCVDKILIRLNNKPINNLVDKIINKGIEKPNAIPIIFCSVIALYSTTHFLFNLKGGTDSIYIHFLILIQFVASISDINNKMIPLQLTLGAMSSGILIMLYFESLDVLKERIISAGLAFIILFILLLISKGQIGGGDLMLFLVTGFFTGIPSMLSILFLSVVISGLFSIVLVVFKKRGKSTEIPFAPFVLLATSISAIYL